MEKLTEVLLTNAADKCKLPITYGRYRMWKHIPFIGNTAICVDVIVRSGGYKLMPVTAFPRKIDLGYIVDAVKHGAISLGQLDMRNKNVVFTPWHQHIGEYPPGYFAHRVGDDIDERKMKEAS